MTIADLVEECETLRRQLSRSFLEAARPTERFAISEAVMQVIEVRRALERGMVPPNPTTVVAQTS